MKNYNIDNLNTIEELQNLQKEVCEAISTKIHTIQINERANELSNRSFGFIKESFENMSPVLYASKEGKVLLNKYIQSIRESNDLSQLHLIYENVRKAHKDLDIDYFIDSLTNEKWNVNKTSLAEATKKTGTILAEAYKLIGEDAEQYLAKEDSSLTGAIEYISENSKNKKNIIEYSDAIKVIKESVMKHENSENQFKSMDLDTLVSELVNEYNKKYEDVLSEEEVELVKGLSLCEDKETKFNEYKENCLSKLSEAKETFTINGDSESADRIHGIQEQVSNKQYTEESFVNDVCNLIEISNVLK